LDDIKAFLCDHDGPEHEFLNLEFEVARQKFRESCEDLMRALAGYTFPTHIEGHYAVPADWEIEAPERFNQAVSEIHTAADGVCSTYDVLVRLARKNLAV
jgi:hypothetical protein